MSAPHRIGQCLLLACATALATAAAAPPALAQAKLRVGDSLPLNHFFAENATRFWMEEVTKQTNGAVTFEYFPAEQLGKAKDMLSLTQSGVIDVGYVVPTYVQDKMPLSSVAELPGTFTTSCQGTMAFWQIARSDGALARWEYQGNGVRIMFAIVMPPYQIFTGQKVVRSIKDIEGLKLRTTGGAQDTFVDKLGGVPVRMAAPDLHEALSRGTVDGMVFPASSVLAYDIAGLVKSAVVGENFGSAVLTYMMAESRWKSLPQAVRDAMTEAGEATTRRICAYADRQLEADIEKIGAAGAATVHLPEAEHARLSEISAEVRKTWAEALNRRGKPGSEVLDAFMEAVR